MSHRFFIAGWVALLLFLFGILVGCGDNSPEPPTPVLPTAVVTPSSLPSPIASPTVQTVRVSRVERPAVATLPPPVLAPRVTPSDLATSLPLLAAHLDRVRLALQQPVPVLPLSDGLDANQQTAQQIALRDPQFTKAIRDEASGAPLRNEIFGIYPLRPSDITAEIGACRQNICLRVELYNYAHNLTTVAIVNVNREMVMRVDAFSESQPDLPAHLIAVAEEIAANAAEVTKALGGDTPQSTDALMASTKTALNASRCERSHHLCVAPTFVRGDHALWAIVDLTEGTLVGVRWTYVGNVPTQTTITSTAPAVTEKLLQDEVVTQNYCDQVNTLAQAGWELEYLLTSSDGLLIRNVRFNAQPVLESAKLVDWHVSYSARDGFGYSDAIGCPIFSQAAVVAFNGPQIDAITVAGQTVGFALSQHFKSEFWPAPCNYYYSQRYEFYTDGRFRVVVANHGRGCGNDGTYRPVIRIVPAGAQEIAAWTGSEWQGWSVEAWQGPSATVTAEGYQFRLRNRDGQGYYLVPGNGQFADGGRGDQPYLYATRHHTDGQHGDEGDADLITIGSCCNQDYQQGPEKFINTPPEAIADTPLVIWYVAQLDNDDTPGAEYCWAGATLHDGVYLPVAYPCFAGPLFVPISQ